MRELEEKTNQEKAFKASTCLLPFGTNSILPGFLRKLRRVELWTENRFDEIWDFVMICDIIWWSALSRWGWLQEDRHKATAVVDPGNRRGAWWRSRSKKSFHYEEKEEPTTCIYNILYIHTVSHTSLLFPSIHLYTHRCLHFTAQVSQRFLPTDSRLSPGGLPSFFIQREICHQLSTTDLERSVSDVGSVDLLRIWFWLALPWTHQKVICSVETGRGSGSLLVFVSQCCDWLPVKYSLWLDQRHQFLPKRIKKAWCRHWGIPCSKSNLQYYTNLHISQNISKAWVRNCYIGHVVRCFR